jgi:energy-converting hydrogenase Eha subunit G
MMDNLKPWTVGAALAITLAVAYTVCAAAFALRPEETLTFFNAWFHGVDLRVLQPAAKIFTLGVFFYGLSGIVLTGFAMGVVYGMAYNLFRRCPGCR